MLTIEENIIILCVYQFTINKAYHLSDDKHFSGRKKKKKVEVEYQK